MAKFKTGEDPMTTYYIFLNDMTEKLMGKGMDKKLAKAKAKKAAKTKYGVDVKGALGKSHVRTMRSFSKRTKPGQKVNYNKGATFEQ